MERQDWRRGSLPPSASGFSLTIRVMVDKRKGRNYVHSAISTWNSKFISAKTLIAMKGSIYRM